MDEQFNVDNDEKFKRIKKIVVYVDQPAQKTDNVVVTTAKGPDN